MSEKEEVQDTGPEAAAGIADPAAVALALSGASRERADAFLKQQEALIEDQRRLVGLQAHMNLPVHRPGPLPFAEGQCRATLWQRHDQAASDERREEK